MRFSIALLCFAVCCTNLVTIEARLLGRVVRGAARVAVGVAHHYLGDEILQQLRDMDAKSYDQFTNELESRLQEKYDQDEVEEVLSKLDDNVGRDSFMDQALSYVESTMM